MTEVNAFPFPGEVGYSAEQAAVPFVGEDGALSDMAKDEVRDGFTTFAAAVSRTAHAHGWWSDDDGNFKDRNMGEMLMLMVSELSEALEAYRNGEPVLWYKHDDPDNCSLDVSATMREIGGVPGKPEGIASEFADCIIRILDTCETHKIPVVQALLDKHAFNITRPYRHGGKVC